MLKKINKLNIEKTYVKKRQKNELSKHIWYK